MSSRNLLRWGGLAAILDGVLWIVLALVKFLYNPTYWQPSSPIDYLMVVLTSAAFLCLLPVLVHLHALQGRHYGRLGALSFTVAFVGAAMAGIGNFVEDWFRLPYIGQWVFVPGGLLLVAGLLLLGIATVRANVLPGWNGWAIIIGILGFMMMDEGGGILSGLVWLVLGASLLSGTRQTIKL